MSLIPYKVSHKNAMIMEQNDGIGDSISSIEN